jgi:hypothetical protein
MRRVLFALLLVLITLTAAAQKPAIDSITPGQGPDSGGTLVTIRGTNLATRIQCIVPCPPRVAFGQIAVDATEKSDSVLEVTTPAHEPGTVDVTVTVPGQEPVVVANGFTFIGGPEAGYEKVLLPIYLNGTFPGAYGTQWRTDFRIRNNGTESVRLAPWECADGGTCPAVFPLTYSLLPLHTLHNPADFAENARSNPGALLYVSKPANVAMSLRVADVSRDTLNAGTDLPVVRSAELLTGQAELFGVPLKKEFRVLLRIYETEYSRSEYSVLLFPEDDDEASPVYAVTLTATTPQQGPFRTEAAYVQFDVTDLLKLRRLWPDAVRIEIIPRTPGSRYWAFASITGNETQLVTLVTPQ